jgi:hypothetical protein
MTSSLTLSPSAPAAAAPRELAAREADGVHVTLLWDPATDDLTVSVDDHRFGVRFEVAVAADRALHAFEHPFIYADEAGQDGRTDLAFSVEAS